MSKKEKRKFIRSLWGVHEHLGRKLYKRRTKIDKDIKLILRCKYNKPFVTYVFGKDNYNFLKDNGFDCVLVDSRPIVWDIEKEAFRHKLEAFKCGMEQYDEVVFLDWDTFPVKPLPDNFWDIMKCKESFQAILRMYKRRKAFWRKNGGQRAIPCASFVYFREKQITQNLISLWEQHGRPWSEEVIMARFVDKTMGNWSGIKDGVVRYEKLFEPDFFYLPESQPMKLIDDNYYIKKNIIFRHFNKRQVQYYLRKGKKINWIK